MTTKTQTTIKPYNRNEAICTVSDIVSRLTLSELSFNILHSSKSKSFQIFGVTCADSIKVIYPQFEIKTDERLKRYAELVISYE